VALMRDIRSNDPTGIHRTFVEADGSGKDAGARDRAKMMLGRSKGSVVKLTPDDHIATGLAIAEGIETALSCMTVGWPTWACLSSAGIAAFPVLGGIEALTIFADHDQSRAGEEAAIECGIRWRDSGAEVCIIKPRAEGKDWNDVLKVA